MRMARRAYRRISKVRSRTKGCVTTRAPDADRSSRFGDDVRKRLLVDPDNIASASFIVLRCSPTVAIVRPTSGQRSGHFIGAFGR